MNSTTSTATGATTGTGWYVDLDPSGQATYDGNAGNNFGDPCAIGTGLGLTWCWQITTNAICIPGSDAGMTINTLADGESGAWNSPACLADPEPSFLANIICCDIPTTASNPPTCIGDANGSATAQGFGGTSPYDYVWDCLLYTSPSPRD